MIKPPAMGVFNRDAPPTSRSALPSNSSSSSSSTNPAASSSRFEFDAHRNLTNTTTTTNNNNNNNDGDDARAPEMTANQTADEDAQDNDDDQGTVDEEAGIIRCICGCDDDDGFTIQCDRCLVWQHCACFGMSQASVPDEYLCEQCEPRPVDVAFAQAHQQKRKNNEARKALMDRNLKRQAQALASANYTQEYLTKEAAYTSSSPSSALPQDPNSFDDAPPSHIPIPSPAPTSVPSSQHRSRKPSQALDLTNTQFVVPELPASAASSSRGAKQRKGQKGSRKAPDTPTSSTPNKGIYTPGTSNERYDDPFDVAEQLEAWHVEFTPISKNVVSDSNILANLAAAMLDWEAGSPVRALPAASGKMIAPVAPKSSHNSTKIHENSMDQDDISPPHDIDSPTDKSLLGLTAIGGECVPVEMEGSSLTDLAARTYVKHISETASAGVFNNVLQINNAADEPQRGWSASKSFSRPVMHGLFADSPIPAGSFISEYRGELYSADAYRKDPINQFAALGATKPHVHLFPPPLNLAIDARRFGNEARFARFSCHPNAVLRPILFRRNGQLPNRSHVSSRAQSPITIIRQYQQPHPLHRDSPLPDSNSGSDEPELLFGIFAISDISRTHEITLGWEWDDSHIVHFLPELVQNPYMESNSSDYDADKHTANMVALVEKGEFPYADTEFSAKMSTVSAALLGCVLCACIGSAAPPGGGGGASANNGRKQDCAVAQMLRVGNGMSLLNVTMPGKSNRRAKLPDFTPLVGATRSWRMPSLPPTPDTSVKDDGSLRDSEERTQALLGVNANEDAMLMDESLDQGEIGCGGAIAGHAPVSAPTDADEDSQMTDSDDDHDARSAASSLTDPLSGVSQDEFSSGEEDLDLARALRMADGLGRGVGGVKVRGSTHQPADHSGFFLLPPKKRSMRTRIKVTMSPSDDEQNDDESSRSANRQPNTGHSRTSSKSKSGVKRKAKHGPSRLSINFDTSDEDEEEEEEDPQAVTPVKKRRKSGIADPSSPLSSLPSPGSDDNDLSPPPPVPSLSAKHKAENEKRHSDKERAKQRRAARHGDESNSTKSGKKVSKESASKRKLREEARLHRESILDMGDTESSDDDDEEEDEADATPTEDTASATSTPTKTLKPPSVDASVVKAIRRPAIKDATKKHLTVSEGKVQRSERSESKSKTPSSPVASTAKNSTKNETPSKIKKIRRIVSDSESSDNNESERTDARVTPTPVVKREGVVSAQASELRPPEKSGPAPDEPTPVPTDKSANQEVAPVETEHTQATASATAPASDAADAKKEPANSAGESKPEKPEDPKPEIKKKEEPRVKLSLAEYKRRLAERRISEQQNASAPLPTPSPLPTPVIESLPTPGGEKREPVLNAPLASSATNTAANVASPTTSIAPTPNLTHADNSVPRTTFPFPPQSQPQPSRRDSDSEGGKRHDLSPIKALFSSISAPTAIRSVEIPKSPSPEASAPAPTTAFAKPAQDEVKDETMQSPDQAAPVGVAAADETSIADIEMPPAASAAAGVGVDPTAASAATPTAGSEAPSLLMRLESRRAQGQSQGDEGKSTSAASVSGKDGQGFIAPSVAPVSTSITNSSSLSGVSPVESPSNPTQSPFLGPVRPSSRPPQSPSSSTAFNPPKAPRAFMTTPGSSHPALPPAALPTGANAVTSASSATGSASAPAPIASGPNAMIATPGRSMSVTGAGVAPSPASSSSSSMSARYPATHMSPPSPAAASIPGGTPRDYAGIPKGPASMREHDPRMDAWVEARELREFQSRPGTDPMLRDGRDAGWADRARWDRERERDRDFGREYHGRGGERDRDREMFHRGERDPRDVRTMSTPRDERDHHGTPGLAGRMVDPHAHPHPHSHGHPYRRPSLNEYEDPVLGPASPYERSSDPYNRGIVVRGRSLGMNGGGGGGGGVGGMPHPSARDHPREYRDMMRDMRDPRDYDDSVSIGGGSMAGSGQHYAAPAPSSLPPSSSSALPGGRGGGYRGGGWGGRPRGSGRGGSGMSNRGRGGWMR